MQTKKTFSEVDSDFRVAIVQGDDVSFKRLLLTLAVNPFVVFLALLKQDVDHVRGKQDVAQAYKGKA